MKTKPTMTRTNPNLLTYILSAISFQMPLNTVEQRQEYWERFKTRKSASLTRHQRRRGPGRSAGQNFEANGEQPAGTKIMRKFAAKNATMFGNHENG